MVTWTSVMNAVMVASFVTAHLFYLLYHYLCAVNSTEVDSD